MLMPAGSAATEGPEPDYCQGPSGPIVASMRVSDWRTAPSASSGASGIVATAVNLLAAHQPFVPGSPLKGPVTPDVIHPP
jgi:hypothetical protein